MLELSSFDRLWTDIRRDREVGDATVCQCRLYRFDGQTRHLAGDVDRFVENASVGKERVEVDFLVIVAADFGAGNLTGQGQHRRVIFFGIVQAVEQMDRTRPDCPGTYSEIAGHFGLRAGGERADLLVANMNSLDPIIAANCIDQGIDRVADDAEDLAYTSRGDGVEDGFEDGWF